MEFLKDIFKDGAVTFEQFASEVSAKGYKIADLSTGNYVAKKKYEDELANKDNQINTLNTTISTRDTDLATIKKQLEDAGEDKTKLATLSEDLTNLQAKYDTDVKEYQSKLQSQAYEFAVKEYANNQKFANKASKQIFIQDAINRNLQMENSRILGMDDFKTEWAKNYDDAFASETPETPPTPQPSFVTPTTGNGNGGTPTNPFNFGFTPIRGREK